MCPDRIRVMVVDDHAMVRSGLRLFLMAFDDMILAGEASNGLEAVRMSEQTRPDVILMDLIMPVMDGIHATQEIVSRSPQTRVIALTSFVKPELIQEALDAGAVSFLLKDISASELAAAIRSAYEGRGLLSPEAVELLKQMDLDEEPSAPPQPIFDLTDREREVLGLMVSGQSNAEIAEQLVVSLSTVKYHVSKIFERLNAANRAEAVAMALQYRLVDAGLANSDSVERI